MAFSVVQFSCSVLSDSLRPHGLQHARPPVHHQLPEFTQTHVHRVGDAIQPSHSLPSPSPLAFNLSQSHPTLCDPMDCSMPESPSFTISRSLLKLMSTELVMPSNHLTLCCPPLLLPSASPSIRVFQMSQLFASGGQSIGAPASVLPVTIQHCFPRHIWHQQTQGPLVRQLCLLLELFNFFLIFIFTLFYFTILSWFCHTLT